MSDVREKALKWWQGLENGEQFAMLVKHYPKREFYIIDNLSTKIETMFLKEHKNDKNGER